MSKIIEPNGLALPVCYTRRRAAVAAIKAFRVEEKATNRVREQRFAPECTEYYEPGPEFRKFVSSPREEKYLLSA